MPYAALDPSLAVAAPTLTIGQPKQGVSGYTLEMYVTEMAQRFAGRTDVSVDRLKLWINDAYIDMATMIDPLILDSSYSFSLTIGNSLYVLPEQVLFIHDVSVVDSNSIYGGKPLRQSDLSTYRMAAVQNGQPHMYFLHGELLVFWPDPDAAQVVAVDFRVRPTDMLNDLDQPFFSREWHEGVLLLARAKGFSALQEWEASALAENEFSRWVERRLDQRAAQDRGRLVGSAVPRTLHDLRLGKYLSPDEPW